MEKEHRIIIKPVMYGFGRYEVRLQQKCKLFWFTFWDTLSTRKFCNVIDAAKLTIKWQAVYGITNIIDETE